MSSEQLEEVLGRVAGGELGAKEAIALLVAGGEDPVEADQAVFITLGGSDVVEVGDDGRERYIPSGKLVSELNEAMER